MTAQHQGVRYRPDIDGLRGIAVLGVVLFHAGLGVPGGYVGVDVFFVISGFLITSLILNDLRQGTFSMVKFWERRVRRIFPALAVMVAVSAFTGKNLLFHSRIGQVAASRILPLALALARRLGISRDRLGNSFVRFSNAVVSASHSPGKGKTIILIPRCLQADIRKTVQEMGARAGVGVFVATGGGEARKVIQQERPSAVIGVACERDLISGIHDVAPKVATLGVANQRPEGPCKNTLIDLEELRAAIQTLTGITVEDSAGNDIST